MLVIRMQRTGRSGHAQFRVVVQDSRRTPTSGKVVAHLGHFDPHSKQTSLNKEKAEFYLSHGAQPSDRVARLLKAEGVKLPTWVSLEGKKTGKIRNQDKLRRNRPAAAEAPVKETPAEPVGNVEAPVEAPTEAGEETPAEASETQPAATTEPAAETTEESPAAAVEAEPETSTETEPETAETDKPKTEKS